jgi:hypothetical protein
MNVRLTSMALACLLFTVSMTACAAPPSNPLAGTAPSLPAVLKPDASSTVDIHIVNESDLDIEFQTTWSYPAHPFWTNAHAKCVSPGTNWNTFIDYNHPSPQTEVVAYERSGKCSQKAGEIMGHEFKDVHLKNGRGLVQVKVLKNKRDDLEMCWKQGDESSYTCKVFTGF